MTTVDWYKFAHVLAAIVWVGGAIAAQVLALRLKHAEPGHRLGFARDMRFMSQFVFLPAALIAYLTGELMIAEVDGFGHEQAWISIGITGFGVSFLAAAAFLVPQIRKAVRLMEGGQGPAAGAVIARVSVVARAVIVILLVVVWAMVTKPGL